MVFIVGDNSISRIAFAKKKLSETLSELDFDISLTSSQPENFKGNIIVISEKNDKNNKEGFKIGTLENIISIEGADATGALYGALELSDRIKASGKIPSNLNFQGKPEMVLRGTCIGLQKTEYLPGRTVYEYPYTPENFPWFYDKAHWIEYLDMMVENRYNSLYLWNGHPFASLVKLDDYPYAVEVDEETFKKNEEIFKFITEEADKRGIWVIQMFYNILVSKPFAEKHGIKTQERSRPITPLIADYTQKSITEFIKKYPNVGFLVTLGEAMHTIDDDVEWFTKTIIPGVKDGLKQLGLTNEPPIVLRGHDTDAERVMEAALPIYKNLYTTFKYNGESLTTYQPRDAWEAIPKALSELGSVHISNVHILANLEPFRYSSPDFIQKSVKAMHNVQGANGLHLYPQSSYWDWPYTADKPPERLKQIDRDWMWYEAWARYAWDSNRDRNEEINYWSDVLGDYYDCGENGKAVLDAYEQTGEIAPKLLRTFGISDGNRQTLLLGMFMGQLVNPFKYHVYKNFLSSNGPVGEILIDYAEKEWKGEPHVGETPPQIIEEVVAHGKQAVKAIEKASVSIGKNKDEFQRLKNDVYCYDAFANFFAEKVKAAMLVLNYKYSNDITDLEKAIPHLEKSIAYYTELTNLTKDAYLYANSMQTAQRRIPITGRDGKNKTWEELLPHYQNELDVFKRNVVMLKSEKNGDKNNKEFKVFEPVEVTILNKDVKRFPLKKGQSVYNDNDAKIEEVADELKNLSGVQFSDKTQQEKGTVLHFETERPVKVLVGYFNTNSYTVLEPPTLETNAYANDRGQADIKIANAMLIPGLYPVNVYSYRYEPGEHKLVLGKGRVLILGYIDGDEDIVIHDARITNTEDGMAVDWLFY
ncbi:glycoside hydrolase family 20 zincin-like fold domain-containing protein [Flavobacteriaceae bacterium GSB9]|nr:glycoside hydrolase family 20 zincin-like fold domain-containing protein [Flavobacteriaceae bacterium GSB9]